MDLKFNFTEKDDDNPFNNQLKLCSFHEDNHKESFLKNIIYFENNKDYSKNFENYDDFHNFFMLSHFNNVLFQDLVNKYGIKIFFGCDFENYLDYIEINPFFFKYIDNYKDEESLLNVIKMIELILYNSLKSNYENLDKVNELFHIIFKNLFWRIMGNINFVSLCLNKKYENIVIYIFEKINNHEKTNIFFDKNDIFNNLLEINMSFIELLIFKDCLKVFKYIHDSKNKKYIFNNNWYDGFTMTYDYEGKIITNNSINNIIKIQNIFSIMLSKNKYKFIKVFVDLLINNHDFDFEIDEMLWIFKRIFNIHYEDIIDEKKLLNIIDINFYKYFSIMKIKINKEFSISYSILNSFNEFQYNFEIISRLKLQYYLDKYSDNKYDYSENNYDSNYDSNYDDLDSIETCIKDISKLLKLCFKYNESKYTYTIRFLYIYLIKNLDEIINFIIKYDKSSNEENINKLSFVKILSKFIHLKNININYNNNNNNNIINKRKFNELIR